MPTIYPLLKPHDWPLREHVAYRRISETVEGVPIVAFGFDTGDNYQFVPAQDVDDTEALYREALGNLAALDYPWETSGKGRLRLAASSGNDFSAERLLDKKAMIECQRLLECERILVAAPRRTSLIATREGQGEEENTLFYEMVKFIYLDDSERHAPISPALYVVEDGVIKQVRFAVDELAAGPPTPPSAKPWWKFWK